MCAGAKQPAGGKLGRGGMVGSGMTWEIVAVKKEGNGRDIVGMREP